MRYWSTVSVDSSVSFKGIPAAPDTIPLWKDLDSITVPFLEWYDGAISNTTNFLWGSCHTLLEIFVYFWNIWIDHQAKNLIFLAFQRKYSPKLVEYNISCNLISL